MDGEIVDVVYRLGKELENECAARPPLTPR